MHPEATTIKNQRVQANGVSKVMTEAIKDDPFFARRVRWIEWDSGFRGSGLQVGDRVVGDLGELYNANTNNSGAALGGPGESQRLSQFGLAAGSPVTVLIERKGQRLNLEGRLTEYIIYRNDNNLQVFGKGGPVHHEKDGFEYAWKPWYSNFQGLAETVLAGWDYTLGYDTRNLRKEIETFSQRVAFLEKSYPGPFAQSVREDYNAMITMVGGEKRELSPEQLEYRQLGERRAAQVAQAADTALAVFLKEVADTLVPEAFPAPDPFKQDVSHLIGRTVRLPEISDDDLLLEVKGSWYYIRGSGGAYLVDRHANYTKPLYVATDKYIEQVNPFLRKKRISFIGTVEPLPALVSDVRRNITVVGLRVKPMAALVKDSENPNYRFFTDLRPENAGKGAFAGEKELFSIGRSVLKPEATPAEVLSVFFRCLMLADYDTWRQCYATWTIRQWFERNGSYLYVDLAYNTISDRDAATLWDKARQRLMDDVYGVEVAEISAPQVVYNVDEQPSGHSGTNPTPRIVEEVRARINHIGHFNGEYRTFAGYQLHRSWRLQRLDDSPWRIITPHAL